MEYTQIKLDDWTLMKENLRREIIGAQESFVRIGYTLRTIEEQRLYEKDGFHSIVDFAKAEYGLGGSAVSRFIDINKKFSVDGYSDRLRPELTQMGSSKLSEMLALPDSDLSMITPETTRADIRELKKFNKSEPDPNGPDDLHQLIHAFLKENDEILSDLKQTEVILGVPGGIERGIEIVNPSGSKVFRKGLYFMAMNEKEIKLKKCGGEPETLTWQRFFEIVDEVLPEFVEPEDLDAIQEDYMNTEETDNKPEEPDTESEDSYPEQVAPAQIIDEAHPVTEESICYQCANYENCTERQSNVRICDRYLSRKEAQKTEEQRYNEEQNRIDRETAKKLKEEQSETTESIAEDVVNIRCSFETYDGLKTGEKPYIIRKKDRHTIRVGKEITFMVFVEGAFTGRQFKTEVKAYEDSATSSGIADGYEFILIKSEAELK